MENPLTYNMDMQSQPAMILSVDDDPVNQLLLTTILKKFGYKTMTASNGKEALSAYTKNQDTIDLILMDLYMPLMDGAEATRQIRTKNKEIPIILITTDYYAKDSTECKNAGFTGFLDKPIDNARLLAMLQKHIKPCPTPK